MALFPTKLIINPSSSFKGSGNCFFLPFCDSFVEIMLNKDHLNIKLAAFIKYKVTTERISYKYQICQNIYILTILCLIAEPDWATKTYNQNPNIPEYPVIIQTTLIYSSLFFSLKEKLSGTRLPSRAHCWRM